MFRRLAGATTDNAEGGPETPEIIEAFFQPANRQVMRIALGDAGPPLALGFSNLGMVMSRFHNTFLHAGAAIGVDPDNFREVVAFSRRSIDAKDDMGYSPLMLAMRFSNFDMARILLEGGAKPSIKNNRGETPWHWLISLEDNPSHLHQLVQLLSRDKQGLRTVAQPRNTENDPNCLVCGGTPLHWAVQMRQATLATALVGAGADPALSYRGTSSIDLAIQLNYPEILNMLLEAIHQKEQRFQMRPGVVTNQGSGEEVKIEGTDDEGVLLMQATSMRLAHNLYIENGSSWLDDMTQTIRLLHKHGYLRVWSEDIAKSRQSIVIHIAFTHRSGAEVLEMLASEGFLMKTSDDDGASQDNNVISDFWNDVLDAIVETSDSPAIHFAIDKARRNSSESRLRNAEELLFKCCSSLHADASVIQSILKDCNDIDHINDIGETAFAMAVRNQSFDIATHLLSQGANVNYLWEQEEEQQCNILFRYVACNIDIDVVPLKYLLEPMHGFDDKVPSFIVQPQTRSTALHVACVDGNPAITEYLIRKFGTPEHLNLEKNGGFTALHLAIIFGHADLAVKLCAAGADANARSGDGSMRGRDRSRPLDLCYRNYTPDAEYLTSKYGIERKAEDIYLGRLRATEMLVRRYKARRASRYLIHRSLALKLARIAAEQDLPRLLSECMRRIKTEEQFNTEDYKAVVDALLWSAAERGNIAATRILLRLGGNANQRARSGRTLLHAVAWRAQAEMVHILAKSGGADINAYDDEGQTPGSFAVKANDLSTLRVVKSLGGLFTLKRSAALKSLEKHGINPARLSPNFNLKFTVKCEGEPTDDEGSSTTEDENELSEREDESDDEVSSKVGSDGGNTEPVDGSST
jgi:ankyrin repeat protein